MSGRKLPSIPGPIREQVDQMVAEFNQKTIKNPNAFTSHVRVGVIFT